MNKIFFWNLILPWSNKNVKLFSGSAIMSCVVIIIPVIVPTQGANEKIMIETAYCIVVAYFEKKEIELCINQVFLKRNPLRRH